MGPRGGTGLHLDGEEDPSEYGLARVYKCLN